MGSAKFGRAVISRSRIDSICKDSINRSRFQTTSLIYDNIYIYIPYPNPNPNHLNNLARKGIIIN